MKRVLLLIVIMIAITPQRIHAQTKDITEFRKGWRFPLELSQGFVGSQQAYAGILSISGMYTLVPGTMRVGAVAGPLFAGGNVQGLGGVRFAIKVKDFPAKPFGTWGNLQLQVDHHWSTDNYAIVGGGIVVEAAEFVLVGAKGYWSYAANSDAHAGWFQFSLGINLCRRKQAKKQHDDDPTKNTPAPSTDDPTR